MLACAWASLGVQVHTLIGRHGLLPAVDTLAALSAAEAGFATAPTLLSADVSDATLLAGTLVGGLLSIAGGIGLWPRVCFPLSGLLYLSYIVVGEDFLAFQWDNLLVETCVLLAFLPSNRSAPLAHLAFRLLLFKLYFESGIAKWQSHLGDWQDGSAMTFYYETAPLPGRLAFLAHHLPEGLHHWESWGALAMELPLPFLIFGPRRARLVAFWTLTAFQVINTATANYGFFTYLACALHVFLLNDTDVANSLGRSLPGRLGQPQLQIQAWFATRAPPQMARLATHSRPLVAVSMFLLYLCASAVTGLAHLGNSKTLRQHLGPLSARIAPLRFANAYHLFGHITRERIEPEVQVQVGDQWHARHLRYKPGDVATPPPYVAPHQPRVDFRLWFYGLGFRRGTPRYVQSLVERVCNHPTAVQQLFAKPLPESPKAVRIALYRYRFASVEQHRATGEYWTRAHLGHSRPYICTP